MNRGHRLFDAALVKLQRDIPFLATDENKANEANAFIDLAMSPLGAMEKRIFQLTVGKGLRTDQIAEQMAKEGWRGMSPILVQRKLVSMRERISRLLLKKENESRAGSL